MHQVFWQRMSWPMAQRMAHSGVLDGIKDEHLTELASLSAFGFNEQNLSRDSKLLSVLEEARAKSPRPYEFEVACLNKKTLETNKVTSGVILMQDYVSCMERHWPAHFRTAFGASRQTVKEFWEKCDLKDPKFYRAYKRKVESYVDIARPVIPEANFGPRFFHELSAKPLST